MNQKGGCLWLLVGLVLAVVAGGLAFATMLRATAAEEPAESTEPVSPVVIVARDVAPRVKISADHLITKEIPLSAIPANAIRDIEEAVGKVTSSQLIAGEILLEPRIGIVGEQRGGTLNFDLDPGKVVMIFPASDILSRTGILKPGDVIDLLYSANVVEKAPGSSDAPDDGEFVTFWALQKVSITALVLPASPEDPDEESATGRIAPESYLLALDPQDALLLKHFKDKDAILDVVLRARGDDADFDPDPVNDGYIIDRFDISPASLP